MKIDVSIGEVVDKLTILDIKKEKILDPVKLHFIQAEYDALIFAISGNCDFPFELQRALEKTNRMLWDIENKLREHEARKDFGEIFVNLARQVYHLNDKRAEIKRKINEETNSNIVEVKELPKYD